MRQPAVHAMQGNLGKRRLSQTSVVSSVHMALYPILMKGNTNRYINLCIYCQNEKTPITTCENASIVPEHS